MMLPTRIRAARRRRRRGHTRRCRSARSRQRGRCCRRGRASSRHRRARRPRRQRTRLARRGCQRTRQSSSSRAARAWCSDDVATAVGMTQRSRNATCRMGAHFASLHASPSLLLTPGSQLRILCRCARFLAVLHKSLSCTRSAAQNVLMGYCQQLAQRRIGVHCREQALLGEGLGHAVGL